MLANFIPADGGHHVVPNAEVAAKLPPGLIALGRTLTADRGGSARHARSTPTRTTSARASASPGGSTRATRPSCAAGSGIFHPTVAVQGIRDLLATNEFRYSTRAAAARSAARLLRRHARRRPRRLRQRGHRSQPPEPRHLPVQPHPRARAAGRHRPARQLHRLDDAEAAGRSRLQHAARRARCRSIPTDPDDRARLPFPLYGSYMDIVDNRGSGQFNAVQFEVLRRYKGGLALNAAYTLAHSDSNAPDTGNSDDRSGAVRSVRHREGSRSRPERRQAPRSSRTRRGTFPSATAGSTAPTWRGGRTRCSAGGRCRRSFQARSGQHLTPFFSGFYTTSPWNTGKPLDGLGNVLLRTPGGRIRSTIRTPADPAMRSSIRRRTPSRQPGKLGNAKKGSLLGPGTWVVNFAFYKDVRHAPELQAAVLGAARQRVQPPAVLPDLWERVRRSDVVSGRRGCQQRDDRRARSGLDRQYRRVLARTGHTTGVTGEILIVTVSTCHENLYRRTEEEKDGGFLSLNRQ